MEPTDKRFFTALARLAADVEGVDPALADTARRAADSGDPLDMQAAQRSLEALDTPLRDRLLRQVHLHMATDISAIWDALPGAKPGSKPN